MRARFIVLLVSFYIQFKVDCTQNVTEKDSMITSDCMVFNFYGFSLVPENGAYNIDIYHHPIQIIVPSMKDMKTYFQHRTDNSVFKSENFIASERKKTEIKLKSSVQNFNLNFLKKCCTASNEVSHFIFIRIGHEKAVLLYGLRQKFDREKKSITDCVKVLLIVSSNYLQ